MAKQSLAEQKEATTAALARLHGKVAEIATGEEWKAWILHLSRFHDYSPQNRLWLWCQWQERREADPSLPEFSHVAAFSAWKDAGRMVRKGEKALSVFAPILVNDKERMGADGKPAKKLIGFKLLNRSFEVSQTDGDPLPENPVRCEKLQGAADPEIVAALEGVATLAGYSVVYGSLPGYPVGVNGYCSYGPRILAVRESNAPAQKVKTLVHEIAHAILHNPEEYAEAHGLSSSVKEVEAESVAYVVADALGIATDAYSVGYVASWGGDGGEKLAKAGERILDTAERILTALDTGTLPGPRGAARQKSADVVAAA